VGAGGVDLDMFRLSGDRDRDRDRRLRFILVLYVLRCTVTFERTTYFLQFSQNSDVPAQISTDEQETIFIRANLCMYVHYSILTNST